MRFNPELNNLLDKHFTTKFERSLCTFYILSVWQKTNALDCVNLNNPITLKVYEKLISLGVLKRNYEKKDTPLEVTYKLWITDGEAKLEEKELNRRNIEGFLNENVNDYVKLFTKRGEMTKGLKPGVMGDRTSIKKKFRAWFINNNYEYTWEQILNATKAYISNKTNELTQLTDNEFNQVFRS